MVKGRRDGGIVLQGLRAIIRDRGEPFAASLIVCESAGEQEAIAVGFDLEAPAPEAREVKADGTLGSPYFSTHDVTLDQGEALGFRVVAFAKQSHIEWGLQLSILVDGQSESVDVGKQTYTTTAPVPEYSSSWRWAWEEIPARLLPST